MAVEYAISFFLFFLFITYVYLNEAFFKNVRKKHLFLVQMSKSHFMM